MFYFPTAIKFHNFCLSLGEYNTKYKSCIVEGGGLLICEAFFLVNIRLYPSLHVISCAFRVANQWHLIVPYFQKRK